MPRIYSYEVDGPKMQIAGLPRSGTTWMQDLLIENFDAGVCISGKHRWPTSRFNARDVRDLKGLTFAEVLAKRKVVTVVMKKRFHDWCESLTRLPRGMHHTIRRLFPGIIEDEQTAKDTWQQYYDEWLWYATKYRDINIIPYEEALGDTETLLFRLMDDFHIPPRHDKWNLMKTYKEGHPKREKYLEGTPWQSQSVTDTV